MSASASAEDSSYAGIVRLVRSAGVGRARYTRLADRYALMLVPAVFLIAGGTWLVTGETMRVLAVLVVATPCPFVLTAPVAVVSGIACAARNGVVVKDGAALEALEQASPHVLAAMLVHEAHDRGLELAEPTTVVEQPGSGVGGIVRGHQVWVGELAAVDEEARIPWLAAAERRARREGCSATVVIVDDEPVGLILFTDELRTDTSASLRALRRSGVDRVVMVAGDRLELAEPIGASLGIDQVFADRTGWRWVLALRPSRLAPRSARRRRLRRRVRQTGIAAKRAGFSTRSMSFCACTSRRRRNC